MSLKIEHFKHAFYDDKEQQGFLVHYYPYDAVKEGHLAKEDWKKNSYSSEILNYKEGRLGSIKYFTSHFVDLVKHAVRKSKDSVIYLVPVPTSAVFGSKNYSTVPRSESSPKNRDDRNILFCGEVAKLDKRFVVADMLKRVKAKTPKEKWTAKQHAASIKIDDTSKPGEDWPFFVLVDDVRTSGATLAGCKIILEKEYDFSDIFMLAIGQSKKPQEFESIFNTAG